MLLGHGIEADHGRALARDGRRSERQGAVPYAAPDGIDSDGQPLYWMLTLAFLPRGRSLVTFAALALWAGPVRGQSANSAAAEALFQAGRESMQQGNFETACARFRESERLERGVGTWLNLGLCEEKLHHWASAWDYYQRVLHAVPVTDRRAVVARQQFDALDPRVPRVVFRLAAAAPASTVVVEANVDYQSSSFGVPIPVDVGDHVFTAKADGFVPREYRIVLAEGERRELVIGPGEAKRERPPAVLANAPLGTPSASAEGQALRRPMSRRGRRRPSGPGAG